MFQPGLKDKMMPGLTTRKLTRVITTGCRSFREVALALLYSEYIMINQWPEAGKEEL